jgi:hypothetical protein
VRGEEVGDVHHGNHVAGDWPWDDHEMRIWAQGELLHFQARFLTPCQDCKGVPLLYICL